LAQVVLDMLLLPHQCNALHMRSASIIDHVLSLGAERISPLLIALVQQAELASRLLAVVVQDSAQATPTGEEGVAPPHLKPCCHAFAMTLAGSLLATAERQPRIAEVLEESPGWAAFTAATGPLAAWEAVQSKPLGGRAPTRQSDMDNESDDEVEFDSNDVQRALAAAQMARSGDDDDDADNERSSQCVPPPCLPPPCLSRWWPERCTNRIAAGIWLISRSTYPSAISLTT